MVDVAVDPGVVRMQVELLELRESTPVHKTAESKSTGYSFSSHEP
jgi:hypothetical protein